MTKGGTMKKRGLLKKAGVLGLSAMMFITSPGINEFITPVQASDSIPTFNGSQPNTIGKISSISKSGNVININYETKEGMKITFLKSNIFRMFLDYKKEFEEPEARNPQKEEVEMVIKDEFGYTGSDLVLDKDSDSANYLIKTGSLTLKINKNDSTMALYKADGSLLWKEAKALQYYDDGKTFQDFGNDTSAQDKQMKSSAIQTLATSADENFFGGGMQNGYFSHKGTTLSIAKTDNKWTDGYPGSPTPFYWSTKGYGVFRNTFAMGTYDFSNTATFMHKDARFDAYYMVDDGAKIIDDFTELTGKPALYPEYAYYLGHANCYSRDYWQQTTSNTTADGKNYTYRGYEFGSKPYVELSSVPADGNSVLETLNGTGKPSANEVLNGYQNQDMPLGWFLPNDGYGCGYGRESTLEGNLNNLETFASAAEAKGVRTGLWTQSDLKPTNDGRPAYLERDIDQEVAAGTRAVKTDVAWVGPGYSMELNSVKIAHDAIAKADDNPRPFVTSLSGWAGTQRYSGLWTGDQYGGEWEYIRFTIPTYIGSGLSGNPNVGSDMDGIFGGKNLPVQTRDYQWKAFTPTQFDMDGWGSTIKTPQANGEPYSSINRTYAKLKSAMMPYNYSLGIEASQTANPMLRAMALEYPGDSYAASKATQYQYMWGPNLLVAPIYTGASTRDGIYLPDEDQTWIDYFTGEQYQGGAVMNDFDAPIWKTPVFVKSGAIIPMTEANNNPEEAGYRSKRIFDVYPDGTSSFTLQEDDGYTQNSPRSVTEISSVEDKTAKKATVTIDGATGGFYAGANLNKDYEVIVNTKLIPTAVTASVDGSDVVLTEANDKAAFDAASNAYYLDKAPVMEKSITAGEEDAAHAVGFGENDVAYASMKLHVKMNGVDATKDVVVNVENFSNEGEKEVKDSNAPAVPTAFAEAADSKTDASLTLTWDSVADVTTPTKYDLEFNGTIIRDVTAPYTINDLQPDTEYKFRVRSSNTFGPSAWSSNAPAEGGDSNGFLVVKTDLNKYRNMPAEMKYSFSGPIYSTNTIDKANNQVDIATSGGMFHSDPLSYNGDNIITIDMGKVYAMDHFDYVPRSDAGNGTIREYEFQISLDGITYKTLEADGKWAKDASTKTIAMDGIEAQFIRLIVKKGEGNFASAHALRPFTVEGKVKSGTLYYDMNGSGYLDDDDLTWFTNYAGVSKDDVGQWGQVSKGDFNYNGVIDAYDLAIVGTKFDETFAPTEGAGPVDGKITLVPDKNTFKAGDVITVNAVGTNLSDINGFGSEIILDTTKYSFVTSSFQNGIETSEMAGYSKIQTPGTRINLLYANFKNAPRLNGTVNLASFKVKALKDGKFDIDANMSLVFNSRFAINDALTKIDTTAPETPEIKESTLTLSDMKKTSITNDTLTTDDGSNAGKLFQSGAGIDKLFDGVTGESSLAQLKWDTSSNYLDGDNKLPEYVKLPLTFNFELKTEKVFKKITIANRSGGGAANSIQVIGHLGDASYDLGVVSGKPASFEFTPEAGKNVFDRVEVIVLESAGNAVNYPSNTNTTGNGNNRILSLSEITMDVTNNIPVQTVAIIGDKNVQTTIGKSLPFSAEVKPSGALNHNLIVESSAPNVVAVNKLSDNDGNKSYMLQPLSPGVATVTVKSTADATKYDTMTVTVISGLDYEEIDKQILLAEEAIKIADLYKPEGITTLTNALNNAKTIRNSSTADQKKVNDAAIAIIRAISALEVRDTDPDKLIDNSKLYADGNNYSDSNLPAKGVDGDVSTFWENPYSGPNGGLPSSYTVTLKNEYIVNQIDYINKAGSGYLKKYEVQVSTDGTTYTKVAEGTLLADNTVKEIKFPAVHAKYVRLVGLESSISTCFRISELNVYGDVVPVAAEGVTVTPDKAEILVSKTTTLTAEIQPADATDTIVWASKNPAIATVDQNGVVTGVKEGETTITATAGGFYASATIKVVSKSDLKAKIDALQAFVDEAGNEAKYTPDSWTAFKQVIADAKTVYDDANATLEDVLDQVSILATAKEDVLIEFVDVTVLANTITEAQKVKNGTTADDTIYTSGSYQTLQDAIAAGIIVKDNVSATPNEIANANKAILVAQKNLISISELREAISENPIPTTGEYTTGSIARLQTALDDATALLTKANATKAEIADAITEIAAAKASLVSLDALKNIITLGDDEKDNADKYTIASFKTFKDAYDQAKLVYAKGNATKAEVEKAVKDLSAGIAGLAELGDKTDLDAEIASSEDIIASKDKYTAVSYAAFDEAYKKAVAVSGNDQATVDMVQKALDALIAAKKNIMVRPEIVPVIELKDAATDTAVKGKIPDNAIFGVELITGDTSSNAISNIVNKKFVELVRFEKISDLSLTVNGDNYTPHGGMLVTMKIDDFDAARHYGIIYMADNGKIEFLDSNVQGEYITFETSHFSKYAIVSSDRPIKDIYAETTKEPGNPLQPGGQPFGPGTGDASNPAFFMFMMMLAGGSMCLLMYKKYRKA